ncbi:MAG: hypothetical protein PHV11_08945 [Candidatus Bipolaricaulis sp.]|nr:hypothetical protein [Candidatus Bipolaricaulis sp.]
MADKLADFYAEITAKFDKLHNDLGQVKKETAEVAVGFEKAGSIMTTVAAGVAAALLATVGNALKELVVDTAAWASEISNTGKAYGLTVGQMQKLGYMEKLEGKNKGTLISMAKYLQFALEKENEELAENAEKTAANNKKLDEMAKAGKEVTEEMRKKAVVMTKNSDALRTLGIDVASFSAMNVYDQLDLVGRKLSEVSDISTRINLAKTLFGRGGPEDLSLMMNWVENAKKADEILKKFGFTDEQIQKVGDLQSKIGELNIAFDFLKELIVVQLGPDNIQKIIDGIERLVIALGDFIKNNPKAIESFVQLAEAVLKIVEAFFKVADFWNQLPAPLRAILGGGGPLGVGAQQEWISGIPKHGSGGIFNRPTIVGDVPEVLLPLSQLGTIAGGENTVVVNVGNYMGDEISKRALVRDIQRILNEENRRSSYKPTETNYYSVGGHL